MSFRMSLMKDDQAIYRDLRRHLHRMPVGYPATRSGVEIRILKRIFSPRQAALALFLTHGFKTADTIFEQAERSRPGWIDRKECRLLLEKMAENGGVFCRIIEGRSGFALFPFVVGMFEFQLNRMSAGLYEDTARYFREGYALEYLSTNVPQMRVIPVESAVDETLHIATYDEVRRLVDEAGDRIGVAECICRKGKDLMDAPCRATNRRNLCFGLRDYFDAGNRYGWLRKVDRKEALAILEQSETEGLVLQSTNEQNPQAICACCGCCCGILATLRQVPNRAAYAAGNFYAAPDPALCVGCGKCASRCHVDAVVVKAGRAIVRPEDCIGCGVCVPVCKKGAMALSPRPGQHVPPRDTVELYDVIGRGRHPLSKIKTVSRLGWDWLGRKVRDHKGA